MTAAPPWRSIVRPRPRRHGVADWVHDGELSQNGTWPRWGRGHEHEGIRTGSVARPGRIVKTLRSRYQPTRRRSSAASLLLAAIEPTLDERQQDHEHGEEHHQAQREERDDLVVRLADEALAVVAGEERDLAEQAHPRETIALARVGGRD